MNGKESLIERIEESFIAIAYAEADDYRDFLDAVRNEKEIVPEFVHPDECQYVDNDPSYLESQISWEKS